MYRTLVKRMREGVRDESGAFAPMTAIAIPTLVLMSMMTVEYSVAVSNQKKMQSATDAALLASMNEVRNLPNGKSNDERLKVARETFKNFYSANLSSMLPEGSLYKLEDADLKMEIDDVTQAITSTVKYDYSTAALGLFHYKEINLEVQGTAIMPAPANNYIIDIVMCMDATGSMQKTLDAVKVQAASFNTDLRAELGIKAENVKIRVKPLFYRDWEDEVYYKNPSKRPWWWKYLDYYIGGEEYYEGGLVEHPDEFIDLDPSAKSGLKAKDQTEKFTDFIGSEKAWGGANWPEAAGACLDEGIRSKWFKNNSKEAKEYFNIPNGHKIIKYGEPEPNGEFSVVTTIPVIVFWTDATINDLKLSKTHIQGSVPNTYSKFKRLWRNKAKIDQDYKLLIHFGPNSGQGWNTVKKWDRYNFGGSLNVGNKDGVKAIAREILESVPDLLRLSS